MKRFIGFLAGLVTVPAFAAPNFSAFTEKGTLYVTVMGNNCMPPAVHLDVDRLCDKARTSRNAVVVCNVGVKVMTGTTACPDMTTQAFVMPFPLKETQVDLRAKSLLLKKDGAAIPVVLNL